MRVLAKATEEPEQENAATLQLIFLQILNPAAHIVDETTSTVKKAYIQFPE